MTLATAIQQDTASLTLATAIQQNTASLAAKAVGLNFNKISLTNDFLPAATGEVGCTGSKVLTVVRTGTEFGAGNVGGLVKVDIQAASVPIM